MRRLIYFLLNRMVSSSPIETLVEDQNLRFQRLGFDRNHAVNWLEKISKGTTLEVDESASGMSSEHMVLFAAIAIRKTGVSRILEVGTFRGETTDLLSKLFPNAKIKTLDLTVEEIRNFGIYTYGVQQGLSNFESNPNIEFLTMNSLELLNFSDLNDLIWVDGNHLSPYTISDIVNSVRLLAPNGLLICDDVYLKKPFLDVNADLSSLTILQSLANAGIIKYELIRKRLGKRFNNFIYGEKYIAIVSKNI